MEVYVPRGVFNPALSVSTGILAGLLERHAHGFVLDAGCGSGLLSLVAARSPRVRYVVGVDSSPRAVAACRLNARLHGLDSKASFHASWSVVEGYRFDVAAVNPPYLPCRPLTSLEEAWCGGPRLEAARLLAARSCRLLRPGGLLVLAYSTLSGPPGAVLPPCRLRLVEAASRVLPWGEAIVGAVLERKP